MENVSTAMLISFFHSYVDIADKMWNSFPQLHNTQGPFVYTNTLMFCFHTVNAPVALYAFQSCTQGHDLTPNALDAEVNEVGGIAKVTFEKGPGGTESAKFLGAEDSFLNIPGVLAKSWLFSMTFSMMIYAQGPGTLLSFGTGNGVQVLLDNRNDLVFKLAQGVEIKARIHLKRWYHITVTYDLDSGKAHIYNGLRAMATRTFTHQQVYQAAGDLKVGSDGKDNFKGYVSCLQVYQIALSAKEIRDIQTCPISSGENKGI